MRIPTTMTGCEWHNVGRVGDSYDINAMDDGAFEARRHVCTVEPADDGWGEEVVQAVVALPCLITEVSALIESADAERDDGSPVATFTQGALDGLRAALTKALGTEGA